MFIKSSMMGNLLCWTIKRPERLNALGVVLADQLEKLVSQLRQQCDRWSHDPENAPLPCRGIVIQAEPVVTSGGRFWVAGGDLKELAQLTTQAEGRHYAYTFQKILRGLEELPIPVIFAIDGGVIGGACELIMAGDFRIATGVSNFQFKQLKVGLTTGYGGCRRLVDLVGQSLAHYWLLNCQELNASTALQHGLIHEIVDHEKDLYARLQALDQHFSELNAEAVATQKKMLQAAGHSPRQDALGEELNLFSKIWGNPHHQKVLDRFGPKK